MNASANCSAAASVMVVDDDASIRRSLSRLLRAAGYSVETFADGPTFLARLRGIGLVGCAILDLHLPETNGLQLQRELSEAGIDLSIVFLTGGGDVRTTAAAMKRGAVDFLSKPVNDDELLDAVSRALEAGNARRAAATRVDGIRQHMSLLTDREREVFDMVVTGMLNKQIAAELGIGEKTVKVHRARVMQKMCVHSLAELARIAEIAGVDPIECSMSPAIG